MLFRTHIVFSVAVYFLLIHFISMPAFVLFFVLVSTAVVDIDIKNSKVGNRWYFYPIHLVTKHRGFFHSLLAGILFSSLVALLNMWAGFGFFVGYISHLILDCTTKSGIKLFWPFNFKISGFVRSGKMLEDIIFVILLLLDIFIVGKMAFSHLF